jgi:hypothetical protein
VVDCQVIISLVPGVDGIGHSYLLPGQTAHFISVSNHGGSIDIPNDVVAILTVVKLVVIVHINQLFIYQ